MKRMLLVFGAGLGGQRLYQVLGPDETVVAFVDNDPTKQGTTLHGHDVLAPAQALQRGYDAIVIASQAHLQIGAQLLALGVPREKIEVADPAILLGHYEPAPASRLLWIVAALSVLAIVVVLVVL
jgi:FlaA1/EpsC-like NDP-sugar epimerase